MLSNIKAHTCRSWELSFRDKHYPPGSKCEALRVGVHLILLYFIRISLLTPETFFLFGRVAGGWLKGGGRLVEGWWESGLRVVGWVRRLVLMKMGYRRA